MLLNRDQILEIKDIETEEVFIKEWNGSVLVRGMTGTERDEYESSLFTIRGKDTIMNMKNAKVKLVQKCVVDEDGKQLFTVADIEALGKKNAGAIAKLYEVAQRLSCLLPEDVEELTKN